MSLSFVSLYAHFQMEKEGPSTVEVTNLSKSSIYHEVHEHMQL